MSKPKHKKRPPQRRPGYATTPVDESEFASNGRRKQMNPAARRLLFFSLICLALSELLSRMQLVAEEVSLLIAIVALGALVVGLYLQFRDPNSGSRRPRL